MKLKELPQVMALSTEEKLELIHELWESIYPEIEKSDEISEEEKRLLDEIWEEHLKNPAAALTMEQFEALLASRRK
jgi:putative addiction module component (TIGR02574 family)